jgi:tRNA1(Val) A37 N6-methylase TrmN6
MSETLLGGRVQVRQPARGFRGGHDAVLLAAAVPDGGASVLELGSGSGSASLCLAARRPDLAITGVEIDPGLVGLAQANAAANGMGQVSFHCADIFALPGALKRDFDHVICNPPFHGPGTASPDPARQAALADGGKLLDWLKVGLQRTVSGGVFTVILRADRLPEALAVLPAAGLTLFPLWPKPCVPAGRVLIQAVKGSGAPARLLPGLILHRADGSHSDESDAVLRNGAALALQNPHL